MAYIDQEQKKRLVAKVKAILPKGMKATFKVQDNSTLIMTFTQVTRDFLMGLAYGGRDLDIKQQSIKLSYADDQGVMNHKLEALMTAEKTQTLTEFATREFYISINPDFSLEKMEYVFNIKKGNTELLKNIVEALNSENFDNSDPMTDYFCRGYYVRLRFGDFYENKPCKIVD